MLQVIKTRGALDISERFGVGVLQPFEYLPAGDCPLELAHKLLKVVLHHTVQVDQLAIDIVDDLNGGWNGSQKIECRSAAKYLNVAFVRREKRKDTVSQTAFAAQPGNDR